MQGSHPVLRICCDKRPNSLLITDNSIDGAGSSNGANRAVPCSATPQPGMQDCCFDVSMPQKGVPMPSAFSTHALLTKNAQYEDKHCLAL
jgi:hypothetical protein